MKTNREFWKVVFKATIAILTAIGTALGIASCIA